MNEIYQWNKIIELNPSIEDLVSLTHYLLNNWTNRDLCSHGYDKKELLSYDIYFGDMLKWAQKELQKKNSKYIKFINTWLYQGKIYRVQDKIYVYRKDREEPYLRKCGLHYHNMIASWSKTYEFNKFNKIYDEDKYMFIEGDTKDLIGFDIVKFCELTKMNENLLFRLKHEQEIIFPIIKKHIISKCYLTPKKFIEKIKSKNI